MMQFKNWIYLSHHLKILFFHYKYDFYLVFSNLISQLPVFTKFSKFYLPFLYLPNLNFLFFEDVLSLYFYCNYFIPFHYMMIFPIFMSIIFDVKILFDY